MSRCINESLQDWFDRDIDFVTIGKEAGLTPDCFPRVITSRSFYKTSGTNVRNKRTIKKEALKNAIMAIEVEEEK